MYTFIIKFLAICIFIYLFFIYFLLIGIWKYSLYKENKKGGFGRSTNHLAAFNIHVDSYSKTLFGYKIKGELKGEKPLRSNVVYYHNENYSKAVIAYGVGKSYIKIYGLPSNMISTNGYVDNIREKQHSHLLDINEIHYPIRIKTKLKNLLLGIFLLVIGVIYAFFAIKDYYLELWQKILLLTLSVFLFGSSYILITFYFKNRGVLTENGILKIHSKKYHIDDLNYEVSTNTQEYILRVFDINHQQILALFEKEKGFKEFYCVMNDIVQKRRKREFIQKVLQTEFYLPLSEKSYYIIKEKDEIIINAFESVADLEKSVPEAIGDEMVHLEDIIKLSNNFEDLQCIILKYKDGTRDLITKEVWEDIKNNRDLL